MNRFASKRALPHLHFGAKEDMKELGERRAAQLREHTSYTRAGVYDPAGVGGTHAMYVLRDIERPERDGGLPKDPTIPLLVRIWKGPMKWIGNLVMVDGTLGVRCIICAWARRTNNDRTHLAGRRQHRRYRQGVARQSEILHSMPGESSSIGPCSKAHFCYYCPFAFMWFPEYISLDWRWVRLVVVFHTQRRR